MLAPKVFLPRFLYVKFMYLSRSSKILKNTCRRHLRDLNFTVYFLAIWPVIPTLNLILLHNLIVSGTWTLFFFVFLPKISVILFGLDLQIVRVQLFEQYNFVEKRVILCFVCSVNFNSSLLFVRIVPKNVHQKTSVAIDMLVKKFFAIKFHPRPVY
jgi:hypothetical protein